MRSCLIIGAALLLTATAWAGEKTLTAASDPWPPFVDPSSPTQGLSLEIVRAAMKTQGYEVTIEFVPWARAEAGLKEGKYDLIPNTWKTEKRTTYLHYSEPYAANQIKFIKLKGDPFEFTGLESLAGKVIGTVRGYGYGDQFLSATNFERDEVVDVLNSIRKLTAVNRRIDLTLEDEIVARHTIAKADPGLLEKIEFTRNSLSENTLHVTSGLVNPKHQEIIAAFNKGLAEIRTNGTYGRIFAAYGIQ